MPEWLLYLFWLHSFKVSSYCEVDRTSICNYLHRLLMLTLLFLWVRTRSSYTRCVSGGTGDESVNWDFLEAKWESLEAQNEISRSCVLGCCRVISRLVCDGLLLTPANASDGLMRTQLPDNWDSVDFMMYVIAQPCFSLSNLHHRDAAVWCNSPT